MEYQVITPRYVADALLESSISVQSKYLDVASLLKATPELGRSYIPENGDDEPPVPCRFYPMPDTTKTIFYTVDHVAKIVSVFALIDQRRNPAYRFRETRQSL